MEDAPLGRTALRLSRVGFGSAAIGGFDYGPTDDRESIATVQAALDAGVTFFDTADVYGLGHAESILRQALGSRARDLVVATKLGVRWNAASGRSWRDLSPAWVVEALDGSLRRLGLDCIPLLQIHWPDPHTPIGETMDALERCRAAGKVLHLGCCNLPIETVAAALEVGRLESIQIPYSLAQREWQETAEVCASRYGMSVLGYNPLAQGLFGGRYNRDTVFGPEDSRSRSALFQGERLDQNLAILDRLKTVSDRSGRTVAQVAIRWVLEQPGVTCAIAGARRPSQVLDNVAAADWKLDRVTEQFLSQR